ncbi:MAG: pacearchaeosortase [Candidatus Pacearchaeota archaeon]|nr:pacearchaeosortase [Candidatus Pacearchaeota archaeon]
MSKELSRILLLASRYLFLVILGLNLWLFYYLLTPITVIPSFYLIKLFTQTSLSGITITIGLASIKLVSACIAGSAFYLLLILNLTCRIKLLVRVKSIIFSFILLLIINIIRIVIFSLLFVSSFSLFNSLHLLVWYGFSAIIVVGVWLLTIKVFKINQVPVYSDLKFLIKLIKK